MQVLTGQWTKLYTHKFRVTYADFTAFTSTIQTVALVNLPRAVEVLAIKIFIRDQFVRSGTASTVIGVSQWGLANSQQFIYASYGSTQAAFSPADNSGTFLATANKRNTTTSPESSYINNQNAPTPIRAYLYFPSYPGTGSFTAGEADIWVITAKLP